MYQRLSAHLTSVELLSDLRESASRISSHDDPHLGTPNAGSVQAGLKMSRSESITK